MRCSLDKEINKCNFFENELCKNKKKCSFQKKIRILLKNMKEKNVGMRNIIERGKYGFK